MTNIHIKNEDLFDKRICLIINQLTTINELIINLEQEKLKLIKDLQQSYDMSDRKIYFNNLGIIINLIDFYNRQVIFLESKYLEYISIMSKNNDDVMNNLLDLWEKEVDIFFSNTSSFEFKAENDNYEKYNSGKDETLEDYFCNTSKKLIKINNNTL